MNVQYLSDAEGIHTAIVIPIDEWNTITAKYEDLKMLEKPKQGTTRLKPSDFVGCISKETAQK